ncbi:hypothetical protein UFOVP820_42 [uncultured Caudovirales phage]|uniref:Uncharacterized protein n=1 Tax=uncultured Caudovirales phage TaxID=2100421 RepID=A0A6J5P244_9CAUD|nr:hypothetical protein UFOVP820_42 [uncultured Caudovirales phage]
MNLQLSIGLLAWLASTIAASWFGYNFRDAKCRAETATAGLAQAQGVIDRGLATARTLENISTQSSTAEIDQFNVDAAILRAVKQRDAFWRNQRESNSSCDAWMRTPVPCRLYPEANDIDAGAANLYPAAKGLSSSPHTMGPEVRND